MVNSLADLGPALKFIGAMDFEEFGSRVAKIEKSVSRLRNIADHGRSQNWLLNAVKQSFVR